MGAVCASIATEASTAAAARMCEGNLAAAAWQTCQCGVVRNQSDGASTAAGARICGGLAAT